MFTLVKKIAPALAAAAMLAAVATPGFAARPHVGNKFDLLVYTHMGPGAEPALIQKLASQWAENNGGTATVHYDTGSFSDFIQLVHSPKAPDIYFGAPDDDTGKYQAAGILEPLPSGFFDPSAYLQAADDAVTFNGKAYAVPLMMDNVAFVYNKSLVPHPPKTWDQLLSIAAKFPNTTGKTYGFLTDASNFYFDYPFFSGFGSYVFKRTSAGYDTSNIGLGNAGAVKALTLFKDLAQRHILPPSSPYSTAQSLFQKGKLAMFIDGTWDVGANRAALGKNFAAAPWPTLPGGGQPRPFSGVFDAFVNQYSPNKSMAYSLLKYLSSQTFQLQDLQVAGRIPALKSVQDSPLIRKDPVISVYAHSSAIGDLLPNTPAMSAVWTPAGNALSNVVTGKASPQAAAASLAKQVQQGISQLGQ